MSNKIMNEMMEIEAQTITTEYFKDVKDLTDHHNYPEKYIGASDGAELILRGCPAEEERGLKFLHFGQDDAYMAHIVGEACQIPSHYTLEGHYKGWLRVYDDMEQTVKFEADDIKIYRAGMMGCIIQLSNSQ